MGAILLPTAALGFLPASVVSTNCNSLVFVPRQSARWRMGAVDAAAEDGEVEGGIMSSNWLSHAMLRVPNVNATVDSWIDRGATLTSYRKAGQSETAFIKIGNGQKGDDASRRCFSLEVTKLPDEEEIRTGNAVSYFGLSMLLDFRNNLVAAAAGGTPQKRSLEESLDANGYELRSVASGPGDYFCRLCLRTASDDNGLDMLQESEKFYKNLLGLKTVAVDDDLLAMRCPQGPSYGVPASLIFVRGDDEPLDHGNSFDHIVISTKSVEAAAEALRGNVNEGAIFMEPREMFGMKIFGLKDPNGYSVYLAEMDAMEDDSSS